MEFVIAAIVKMRRIKTNACVKVVMSVFIVGRAPLLNCCILLGALVTVMYSQTGAVLVGPSHISGGA